MSTAPVTGNRAAWFDGRKPNPAAKLRLFCLPYAGGGSSIYRGWEHSLPAGVDVWPVQLPGRGSRFNEPPYDDMDSLADDVAEAVRPFLDLPFSVYGHSFGGMLGFEVARRLSAEPGAALEHLFASGCRAPHLPRLGQRISQLPEEQFIREIEALNGTPREVLENHELMRATSGALRADYKLAETYTCPLWLPLRCPITALGGTEDPSVSPQELEAWGMQTTSSFNLWMLPGDHFFLHTSDSMVLQILSLEFRKLLH